MTPATTCRSLYDLQDEFAERMRKGAGLHPGNANLPLAFRLPPIGRLAFPGKPLVVKLQGGAAGFIHFLGSIRIQVG